MRLDRLNVFLDAAQTLNFSETAQRLHISQSTVSKHIGDLERQLNVILFERANGRLRLSEAGRALIPCTRQLMREVERFQAVAQSLPGDVAGPLRIACTTAAGKYVLPRLAVRFRERFPNVQISMLGCRPMEVEDFLRDTKADLAVVSAEATDPALECQHFFTDQVILIVPSGHAWALRQRVEPDELVGEPLLLREPTSGTRRVLQSALAARDIALTDLNVALELATPKPLSPPWQPGSGALSSPSFPPPLPWRPAGSGEWRSMGLTCEEQFACGGGRLSRRRARPSCFGGLYTNLKTRTCSICNQGTGDTGGQGPLSAGLISGGGPAYEDSR